MIKTKEIEFILRNKGFEKGTIHILEALNEQVRTINKQQIDLANNCIKIVETLDNVVNGATGMRDEMMKKLKSAGLMTDVSDDGLGASTHGIGDK